MTGAARRRYGRLLAAVLLILAGAAAAAPPLELGLAGRVQVAFTPGDDAGALVVAAIEGARRQILVQAYSFTHKAIAAALVAAHRRGVEVRVLADREQDAQIATSLVGRLAGSGIPVWLDGQHAAAHNKVMVIDAGTPDAAVVTGSFNFTQAAQYRNAENLLILRGDPLLAEAYAANWRRHRAHSLPLRP
ncbi:phospholipase D family protein [Parasulfuritortus cantonensis]|uniref:phospholipase D n=1 Tax=Parasulfuritortus cantonensis TaxID=2528202 RepID=A0A4R1B2H3_9PROT|nr:phospholipase D family protein [Parasulfuritortus cantonensis]TCJ12262.1 phospholipase D family protein [Parasulfuritortus cantonensis]